MPVTKKVIKKVKKTASKVRKAKTTPVKRKKVEPELVQNNTVEPVLAPTSVVEPKLVQRNPDSVGMESYVSRAKTYEPEIYKVEAIGNKKQKMSTGQTAWFIILIIILLLIIVSVSYLIVVSSWLVKSSQSQFIGQNNNDKILIEDKAILPINNEVNNIEGRVVASSGEAVPIVDGGNIEVVNARLSLKQGYEMIYEKAINWSKDAKLIFIKSLGTITPDGRSTEWQIVFGSELLKKGYQFVIFDDQLLQEKEIASDMYGFDLPVNWFDSGEAIGSLANLPQFADATLTGINFYYNEDGNTWNYGISTSKGTTSMIVK